MNKFIVVRNSYPIYPNCIHADVGDSVHWEHGQSFRLIREADGREIFSSAPVDKNGRLQSNNKVPVLCGIIARVKSRGWVLEIKEIKDE